jgi:hypothetical protein
LYKLAHGYEYLQCNELFVVGKSNVHLMLWEFVHVVNDVFTDQIQWPEGGVLLNVLEGFKDILG